MGKLTTRQRECAWLAYSKARDILDPGEAREVLRDVNLTLSWGADVEDMSPCIITSSVIFMGRRSRLLHGREAMYLQMWPQKEESKLNKYKHGQLMDLAGNALNGACVIAQFIVLMMSRRWVWKDFVPHEGLGETVEEVGSDPYAVPGDTVDETITTDVCVQISAGVGDNVIEERQQEDIDFPDSDADGQSEDGAESEFSADQADL